MTSSSTPPPAAAGAPERHAPLRRLTARGRDEAHRVASPLELLFDLCFVVAIAQAGVQLVHAVAGGHAGEGILNYAMVFFSIWWAWMNFTWFASAYDNDDVLYRVVTLVQIAGVLVLAAGVSKAFENHEFLVVWLGYLIMRLALIVQWLRVALSTEDAERTMALRYVGGVLLCQVGWLGLLLLPEGGRPWVFLVMALLEMCVPPFAERDHPTSWHPHHISERYGLFTIIVLGETIAAATVAVKSGIDEHDALTDLLPIAAGGLLIVFAAWWIYFVVPIHGHLPQPSGLPVGLRPLPDLRLRSRRRRGTGGRGGAGGRQGAHLHAGRVGRGDAADGAVLPYRLGAALPLLQGGHRPAVGTADHGTAGDRLHVPRRLGGVRGRDRLGAGGGDRRRAHGAYGRQGAWGERNERGARDEPGRLTRTSAHRSGRDWAHDS